MNDITRSSGTGLRLHKKNTYKHVNFLQNCFYICILRIFFTCIYIVFIPEYAYPSCNLIKLLIFFITKKLLGFLSLQICSFISGFVDRYKYFIYQTIYELLWL